MNKKSFLRSGAILALFSILGAIAPPLASPAQAAVSDWQKAVSIDGRYSGDFASDSFRESVRNAKAMGANQISLIIPYYQANKNSSEIFNGDTTPSDSTLINAINYIHSLGLKVTLKPHIEIVGGEWRGLIQATNRDAWYSNYATILNHLGDIGESNGVEEIIVGSELIGMASAYQNYNNTERWVTLIDNLRNRYSGKLTYSANWGNGFNYVNEFEYIKFWGSLDYIGISAYFEHWNDGSIPSLLDSWRQIDENQISKLQQEYGKPVLFTEIGYRSVDNAHTQPWNSGMGGNYNAEEQVRDYEALFQYWDTRPYMVGIIIWDWDSDPNYGGEGNTDYTPNNKPAEDTVRKWFTGSSNAPEPAPTPEPTGEWSSSASAPLRLDPGKSGTFPVVVNITGSAQGVISDIEIYDSSNNKVFQQFFENQNISQTTPGKYSVSFTPSQAGTYKLKVGVFKSGWSANYHWNDNAVTFNVGNSTPNPSPTPTPSEPGPTSFETDIWWPSDGATVNGLQPFKAMVKNKSVSEYTMYWQVDGDVLVEMQNSDVDYPHKEMIVDLSGWNWRGEGPYNVNFVSKDINGNVISQRSTNIFVR